MSWPLIESQKKEPLRLDSGRGGDAARTTRRECPQHGFTLVELLVVVAIIGVLVSLMLPALTSAKETANRTRCSVNLRNIGQAVVMYADSRRGAMPLTSGVLTDSTPIIWVGTASFFGFPNQYIHFGATVAERLVLSTTFNCPSSARWVPADTVLGTYTITYNKAKMGATNWVVNSAYETRGPGNGAPTNLNMTFGRKSLMVDHHFVGYINHPTAFNTLYSDGSVVALTCNFSYDLNESNPTIWQSLDVCTLP